MSQKPWVPYVAPFAVYLALTGIEVRFPAQYPVFYTVKIILTTLLALWLRPRVDERRRWPWAWIGVAVIVGVALNWVWFAVDGVTPHPHWLASITGKRPAFDPFAAIVDPVWRWVFIVVRFAGLVVLVPYLEELFFRDFVLRWIVDPDDFRRVPVGKLTPTAVALSTVLFASTHPEYLAAVVFAVVMCALVRYSGDVRVCMVAHGATNLALGIYVILTKSWGYW